MPRGRRARAAAETAGARAGTTGGRAGAAALLAAALVVAGAPAALGQSVQEVEAGRFEIRVGDRSVGTETFAVRREDGVFRAAGRLTLERGAPGLASMDVRLQTSASFRPNSYALRASAGDVRAVDGVWSGDRLRLHIASEEGERWKEYLTPGPVAILEDGVAHHFYLLFRQLGDAADGARIPVILPAANRQATATIRRGQAETVRVGDEDRAATRWDVEVDGRRHRVWLDPDGRVLRVATPGEDRLHVRVP